MPESAILVPDSDAVKEEQAIALINQGKLEEAETIYRELVDAGTGNHAVYSNLAAICGMQGRFAELVHLLGKALELRPDFPDAHNNLGNALKGMGDLAAAIAAYSKALELNPNFPDAHNNLGLALQEQGDLAAAIASYRKALELKPNYPEACTNLGLALQEQGDVAAAIASYNKALDLRPDYPETHCDLGNALAKQGDLTAAIASYKKALELKSNYPEAHNNLGNALTKQGDLTAGIASYRKALELKPSYPKALINLGNALAEQGDLEAAIKSYNKAMELQPGYPEAHRDLAMRELQIGDYRKGWERYEYRFGCERNQAILSANPPGPRWSGDHPPEGSRLLVVSEQGLGDTLQFMRYIIALRSQGIQVSLCAPQKLHGLIRVSAIDASPLKPEQANEASEWPWIPLLSVPRYLGVGPGNPVIAESYIKTTDELTSQWQDILANDKRPIIGINWQGNPGHEKTSSKGRSLPLEAFAPIAQVKNASLLSLQKGFGSEQLASCTFRDRFVSCQPQVDKAWDFLETAAIIANCDLVITSDTSVAHLAGGMGKTTWLLLKQVPEWRWGLEGDTTFWYPSMRLFRQRERGNWDEVLQRVAEALQKEFPAVAVPESANAQPRREQAAGAGATRLPPIQAPISLGELIDKITILELKSNHIQGSALGNVQKELAALQVTLDALDLQVDPALVQRLKDVNADLWQIEDSIRNKERNKDFGEGFIQLARSVYQQNDRRAAIKKEINTTYGSMLTEEKAYQDY